MKLYTSKSASLLPDASAIYVHFLCLFVCLQATSSLKLGLAFPLIGFTITSLDYVALSYAVLPIGRPSGHFGQPPRSAEHIRTPGPTATIHVGNQQQQQQLLCNLYTTHTHTVQKTPEEIT